MKKSIKMKRWESWDVICSIDERISKIKKDLKDKDYLNYPEIIIDLKREKRSLLNVRREIKKVFGWIY